MNNTSLYQSLKEAFTDEFTPDIKTSGLEDAYEKLYQLVTRLQDMDDFNSSMLEEVRLKINSGIPFLQAFKGVIDTNYEFANYDYFKDSFKHYEESLKDLFNKAITSTQPGVVWGRGVNALSEEATIKIGDKDYTLDELKTELDKEVF